MKAPVVLALVIAAPFTVLAATRPHLDSRWRTVPITVDAQQDGWPTSGLTPIDKAPFAVDVVNDGSSVYVRLDSSDPEARAQIQRQGLIVWFDPAGGTKKRFGIRYPYIVRPTGFGGRGFSRGGQPGPNGGAGGSSTGPDAVPGDEPPELEVLGPAKDDAHELMRDRAPGIETAVRQEEGVLIYEIEVPLQASGDHPYAIGAKVGQTIGIGFESPKIERPANRTRGGGFGGGGFRGGMGGRRGGGGMGRRGGGGSGFQPPKPIKAWTTVTLASRP
ncbi:MAG TPA: hypothetical protein VFX12_16150 [Vicinamibacterales bacterium]|nr:hypothetical protein [Vicinamibacterales bacterium]